MTTSNPRPAACGGDAGSLPTGRVWIDEQDPSRLWMSGEVDLYVVETAGRGLWPALAGVRVIEAGEMTFMDSMGLQCVTAAINGAHGRQEKVTVVDPFEQVLRVLRVTGIDVLLNITTDEAGDH